MFIVAKGEKNIVSQNSDTIKQYTDVDGPGPPIIINATCVPGTGTRGTSIFLQWAPPEHFNKSIDEYYVFISKDSNLLSKLNVSIPKDSVNLNVCKLYIFKQ